MTEQNNTGGVVIPADQTKHLSYVLRQVLGGPEMMAFHEGGVVCAIELHKDHRRVLEGLLKLLQGEV